MKVTAYLCENCEGVFKPEYITGLIVMQSHLFNEQLDYSINDDPDKTNFHFCLTCYARHVTDLLKGIDRTKDEKDYSYHYKLYSTKFYAVIYTKSLLRSKTKNRRAGKLL